METDPPVSSKSAWRRTRWLPMILLCGVPSLLLGLSGCLWGWNPVWAGAESAWREFSVTAIECAGWWASSTGAGALFWWMLTRVTGARWSDALPCVWWRICLLMTAVGGLLAVLAGFFHAMGGGRALPISTIWGDPLFLPSSVALLAVAMRSAQRYGKEKYCRFASSVGLIFLLPVMAKMAVAADGGWQTSMAPLVGIAQAAVAALAFALLAPEAREHAVRRPALLLLAVALAFSLYFSFSRFLIVSYGQIPAETAFYRLRETGEWKTVSIALGVASVALPWAAVLSATLYRSVRAARFVAFFVLAATVAEACWRALPAVSPSAFVGIGLVALSLAPLVVPAVNQTPVPPTW